MTAPKSRKLIAVLRSNAPAAEKAITCKRLAIYGSQGGRARVGPVAGR